ncbi:tlde1 domain-containing protein [Marinobacter sp.]|uniref:tlde1 domain-containing protein n=1 Tax=Marinobacter sp. TaxID=50741 RepID=UPI003A8EB49C
MKISFSITDRTLTLKTPANSLTIPATSGRGSCMNSAIQACISKKNEGPIPIGTYYIVPPELSDPNLLGDLARRTQGDWGDWRVRLHPDNRTATFGRDGFFIHGGDTSGSAGCIDIGGGIFGNNHTDRLRNAIESSQVRIPVEVVE